MQRNKTGFTLIEMLIVVVLIGLLVAILMPSLSRAMTAAKIVKAHAELRQITTAIEMYRQVHDRQIPPTRFSCSQRTAYELPIELSGYLPVDRENNVDVIHMPDPFTPEDGYKYRAVGPAIVNEYTYMPNASKLWVPNDFPRDECGKGRYYSNPKTSPVRYAVWSMGPAPKAEKFDIPGRLPVPARYWMDNAGDVGVIVHMEDKAERIHMSP